LVPADSAETVDELKAFDLRIIQKRRGYRFSVDPLLLCDFCMLPEGGHIADLGTGCGVIPLVLARRDETASLVGVEFQPELVELAERNAALNGLAERVRVIHDDILHLRGRLPPSSFDLVTANPPYRVPGTGRVSPTPGRDAARHETTAKLEDFLDVGKYLVKKEGAICLIHHISRLADSFVAMERLKLAPLRLRFVHGTPGTEARMFLVEAVKGRKGELKVLPPLAARPTARTAGEEGTADGE
jgi:tRNA1Val (adenine37-N6)-methyltransferase